jgi:exosortase A
MIQRFAEQWRASPQLMPLLLILLAVPAVFYGTTASMVDIWLSNETFTHGFLILPISCWLIWEQRHRIADMSLRRDFRALLLLLPAFALWLLASLIDVAVAQQLAMVAINPLTVWLVLGLPLAMALLFPLLYLFFAVPLGQSLIPPMMEFTADVTVALVQQSGVPIYRDGLSFELPSGSWAVVEECSGVRYLIASAALGTIYAYITYRSFTKRTLFIIASLIVPIIANGLRAYGIVMIGHLSGMKYAVGADHLLYGWGFFGIVIFILFWIGGFWADPPAEKNTSETATKLPKVAMPSAAFGISVLVALLAANLAIGALKAGAPIASSPAVFPLPASVAQWSRSDLPALWTPIVQNPDRLGSARYRSGDSVVSVDVAYYQSQRDRAEAISSLNKLTDPYDGDWKLTAARSHQFTGDPDTPASDKSAWPGNGAQSVQEAELGRGPDKLLVWQVYLIGDGFIANPYLAKLRQALALLQGQPQGAYVTVSTSFDADLPALRARLQSAWQALAPSLIATTQNIGDPMIDAIPR